MNDQIAFGNVSGDVNPVHVDREYARRTMFGDVIVHAMHGVMWALDRYLAAGGAVPSTLRATFTKPIFAGETVTLVLREESGEKMLTLATDGVALTSIALNPTLRGVVPPGAVPRASWSKHPRALTRGELGAQAAELPIELDGDGVRTMFPALCTRVGDGAAGTLALLSRVVGMECPGRQSLFAGMSATLSQGGGRDGLVYRVTRALERVAPIEFVFEGPGMTGAASAFYRPPEVAQPSAAGLKDHVRAGEFRAQTAVVVGGSRGLGELTAKLLAAGGADVTITYAVGSADAARVRDDIEMSGGRCRVRRLDVLEQGAFVSSVLAAAGVNAVYYFATPRIAGRRASAFDAEKLRNFVKYYVEAFADLCLAVAAAAPGEVVVFYPSTVFVDEPSRENIEYAAAKSAGETLAAYINAMGGVRVVSRRLPRLATDQTAAIVNVPMEDSVGVMLGALRDVDAARAAT